MNTSQLPTLFKTLIHDCLTGNIDPENSIDPKFLAAKDRAIDLLAALGRIQIGSDLLNVASDNGASLAIVDTINIPKHAENVFGLWDGIDGIVYMPLVGQVGLDTEGAVHELAHANQDINKREHFGSSIYFYQYAQSFADLSFPYLIGEADAHLCQAIAAYELMQKGDHDVWNIFSFRHTSRPLADVIIKQLENGVDLHSNEMKRALFHSWMTEGYSRILYESRYLNDHLLNPELPAFTQKGLTHSNEDLSSIVRQNGTSYLEGVDFLTSGYLGVWSELVTRDDIEKAYGEIAGEALWIRQLGPTLESIELVESHISGNNKWQNLPESHNAESLISLNALSFVPVFINKIMGNLSSFNDPVEVQERMTSLLERICKVIPYHPIDIQPELRERVAMAYLCMKNEARAIACLSAPNP